MKLLFWIVGLPLLLLAAFFAVANRETVTISLWPLSETLEAQLWLVIAAPLYVGFAVGALVAWASGHGTRARARAEARRSEVLQRDNAALQQRLDELESRAGRDRAVLDSRAIAPTAAASAAPPALLP